MLFFKKLLSSADSDASELLVLWVKSSSTIGQFLFAFKFNPEWVKLNLFRGLWLLCSRCRNRTHTQNITSLQIIAFQCKTTNQWIKHLSTILSNYFYKSSTKNSDAAGYRCTGTKKCSRMVNPRIKRNDNQFGWNHFQAQWIQLWVKYKVSGPESKYKFYTNRMVMVRSGQLFHSNLAVSLKSRRSWEVWKWTAEKALSRWTYFISFIDHPLFDKGTSSKTVQFQQFKRP